MINQQSTAKNTSSTKQHKTICQLRTNTTALFPVGRGKRPTQQRRQRHHSNHKARLSHRLHFFKEHHRRKESPNDAIPGRMHAIGFFRGYRLLLTIRPFAWRSLTTATIFPLVFHVEKFSLYSSHRPSCCKSDKKRVCNRVH